MLGKRTVWIVAAGVALAAAVGHWWFWYAGRERAASPVGSAAAAVLGRDDVDLAIWVPYPHQNVAHLDAAVGGLQGYLDDLAGLFERRMPALPSFGPLALPPASALGLAVGEAGTGSVALAEVYPVVAGLARISGSLAGNRWLTGGVVDAGSGGRTEVAWEGNVWRLTQRIDAERHAGPLVGAPAGTEGHADGSVLAALRLFRRHGSIPAGSYRLERSAAGLTITSRPRPPASVLTGVTARLPASRGPSPEEPGAGWPFIVVSGTGMAGEPPGGLIIAAPEASGAVDGSLELPGLAVFGRTRESCWRLPGGRLGDLLERRLEGASIGSWWVRASDAATLGRVLADAEAFNALLDEVAAGSVEFALHLEAASAGRLAGRLASGLEEVPLLGRRPAQRWRRVERLLAPLGPERRLMAVIIAATPGAPATVEARLFTGGGVD